MKLTRSQLRRLIRESFSIRKTLFVFDFDDTLAHTDSMVRLERDSELTDLDSGAFAAYTFQPGDQLDFTDFNRVSGKLIANTLAILNNAQRSGQDIVIITARPPGAVPGIQQFFADNNMESPPVYATSGSANKLPVMRNLLVQGDYDHVIVYEDCMKNIEKLGDVVRDMGVSYSAICIDHDTTMRKIYEGNMKITRRQLRRLIAESISDIKSGPVGQVPYEHPKTKLSRAAGDEHAEKLALLLKSDDEENRVMGDDLADTLGYESEFGSFAEDEFEHNVRMASKDPSEDVHSFVGHIIGMELRSVRNKKDAFYTRGGVRNNLIGDAYVDIEKFLTDLDRQQLTPRQALNQIWNEATIAHDSGDKITLSVMRRLMKELARQSLLEAFISKQEAHRYMGDEVKHYPTREESKARYPTVVDRSDRYRK